MFVKYLQIQKSNLRKYFKIVLIEQQLAVASMVVCGWVTADDSSMLCMAVQWWGGLYVMTANHLCGWSDGDRVGYIYIMFYGIYLTFNALYTNTGKNN